jgi:hypothetical protein
MFPARALGAMSHCKEPASMFSGFGHRAIEAFLRRSTSAGEGVARRKDDRGALPAPLTPRVMPRRDVPVVLPPGAFDPAGKLAARVPPQAHRAPYLEDIDDSWP